jgi:DNA-binding response OmpR family regulator
MTMTSSPEQQPRILVVDDDPAIVRLIERFLAPNGYLVQGVEKESDALEQLCDPRVIWHGVVVDATLPLMQYGHLIKAIKEVQPDLPIIVTSALDEESARRFLRQFLNIFLAKPFGHQELIAALIAAGIHSDPDVTPP